MQKRLELRGAIHLHTNLSYDSTILLEELISFLKEKKYDFVAITEHSQNINEKVMNKLDKSIVTSSTSDLLIILGIEFACHQMIHILGLGVTNPCEHDDPDKVIDHIHCHGGIAVLAHPSIKNYPINKSWVEKLDCCEIWNIGNEGKFLPQIESIKKFRELSIINPNLRACCGLDLHHKSDFYEISTIVFVENQDKQDILAALRKGDFKTESPFFSINSHAEINPLRLFCIIVFRKLLNGFRWLRDLIGK
jgi:hypothetical protein